MPTKNHKQSIRFKMATFLIGVVAISVYLHVWSAHKSKTTQTSEKPVVFTPDWGVGATLVAMNHPPIAIGDKRIYPIWVGTPKLPDSVIDIGIRGQPNIELLAQLKPDLILNTFFYAHNRAFYGHNTPIYDIDFGIENNKAGEFKTWDKVSAGSQQIGRLIDKPQQAQGYIDASKQHIIQTGETVQQYIGNKKLLIIDFWDARAVGLDTINSHTTLAATMMGLDTVEIGGGSQWGATTLPMHKLYEMPKDTCLIINKPLTEMLKYDLSHSPIWQRSPFFKPDACVYLIEPVWTNGGIEVLVSFADNLKQAVTTQQSNVFLTDAHFDDQVVGEQ